MNEVMENSASSIEQLTERVRVVEDRVSALEVHPASSVAVSVLANFLPLERGQPPGTRRGFPLPKRQGGMVPAIGKAVFGIAGAYLLRLPILVAAIVYAGL